MMSIVEIEEEFATIVRRNTFNKFSPADLSIREEQQHVTKDDIDANRSSRISFHDSTRQLNAFNDMGHLSRRVSNGHDHQSSFGYRKVFEDNLEVTAITATTIATCVSKLIRELITAGERATEMGHVNASQYDVFCGGGVNTRTQKHQEGQRSNESAVYPHTASKPRLHFLRADTIPPLHVIVSFIEKICLDTQMEYECIIITMIYIRRLLKTSAGRLVMLRENWKGISLACIVVANKVWDDFHMQNLDYCYIHQGLTLQRVNTLELHLLISLDNRCNVSPSVYARTHFEIQSMITLSSIEEKSKRAKYQVPSGARVHPVSEESQSGMKSVASMSRVTLTNVEEQSTRLTPFSASSSTEGTPTCTPTVSDILSKHIEKGFDLPRKGITSADLINQKQNLRVLIHYLEGSIIRAPVMGTSSASVDSSHSQASRPLSWKLAKEHSRKSFAPERRENSFQGASGAPAAVQKSSCLPFSLSRLLCFRKTTEII